MIKQHFYKVTVLLLTTLFCSLPFAQDFNKELSIFNGYLGHWESSFTMEEGKPPVYDVSKWERILNGTALKTTHSINNGAYGGESIIFFDKSKNALVFYYFTTASFYTSGTLEIVDDNTFVAYEDVTGNENGITKVKSVSKLLGDKMTVATSYLKNGDWTKEESRTYTRSTKEVVFK